MLHIIIVKIYCVFSNLFIPIRKQQKTYLEIIYTLATPRKIGLSVSILILKSVLKLQILVYIVINVFLRHYNLS